MTIYTIILVASLVVALVALFTHKSASKKLVSVQGFDGQTAIHEGSIACKRSEANQDAGNGKPLPSDKASKVKAWNRDKTHPATPADKRNPNYSWLLTEKKLLSISEAYKVKRRVESPQLTLDQVCKPFRRKDSSGGYASKPATRPWKQ